MIFSLIVLAFIVYVLWNTKIDGDRVAPWAIGLITVLTMASSITALAMLLLVMFLIHKGVKERKINTLEWIEKLIDDL